MHRCTDAATLRLGRGEYPFIVKPLGQSVGRQLHLPIAAEQPKVALGVAKAI